MKFSRISQETFKTIQLEAGMILTSFDPSLQTEVEDADIVCATTGGITASCVPTYTDYGSDIDNCPNNTMELKQLDGWEATLGFTALDITPETIRIALGAADIDTATGKITPRSTLETTDFQDIWWVGDRADGGMAAICLRNALSTGGFSLKTTKKGKGQLSVTLTGHQSISAQDTIPMDFYVSEGEEV